MSNKILVIATPEINTEDDEKLTKLIKAIIAYKNITQDEVADVLKCVRGTLHNYLSNRYKWPAEKLSKFLNNFEIPDFFISELTKCCRLELPNDKKLEIESLKIHDNVELPQDQPEKKEDSLSKKFAKAIIRIEDENIENFTRMADNMRKVYGSETIDELPDVAKQVLIEQAEEMSASLE